MRYVVTAGYVTVETAVPGGRAHIDIVRGSVLPVDVPAEQVERLLAEGSIVPLPAVESVVAGPEPEAVSEAAPTGTIAEVLAWVGGDVTRAATALVAERSAAKPRATLIRQLAELVPDSEEE